MVTLKTNIFLNLLIHTLSVDLDLG